MMWYGVDTGSNVFYFQAYNLTEALHVAQRDFGSTNLANHLPIVLGEFKHGGAA